MLREGEAPAEPLPEGEKARQEPRPPIAGWSTDNAMFAIMRGQIVVETLSKSE